MYLPTWLGPAEFEPQEPILQNSSSIIAASFSKDRIIDLCSLPHYDVRSHSISYYDLENHSLFSINRGYGDLKPQNLEDNPNFYCIVYLDMFKEKDIQPVTIFGGFPISETIHVYEHFLWFVGSLTPKERDKLRFEEDDKLGDDPMLMLKHVVRYGAPVEVEGSFSCMYSNGKELFICRNEFESMFMDNDMTFCTVQFEGSKATPVNKMFKLDLEKRKMKLIEEFQTVRHWC